MITVTDNSVKAINAALIANNEALKKDIKDTYTKDEVLELLNNARRYPEGFIYNQYWYEDTSEWSPSPIELGLLPAIGCVWENIQSRQFTNKEYNLYRTKAAGYITNSSNMIDLFIPFSRIAGNATITLVNFKATIRIVDGGYADNSSSNPILLNDVNYSISAIQPTEKSGFTVRITKANSGKFYVGTSSTVCKNNTPLIADIDTLSFSLSKVDGNPVNTMWQVKRI